MTLATRTLILRANAIFLLVASTGGLIADIAGSFFGRGIEVAILNDAPGAGIGMLEAHGLAFIIGVLLWQAAPLRSWHFTAAAVHLLLGSANLAFWEVFIVSDALVVGVVTTVIHWALVALQLTAAIHAGPVLTEDRPERDIVHVV